MAAAAINQTVLRICDYVSPGQSPRRNGSLCLPIYLWFPPIGTVITAFLAYILPEMHRPRRRW
jgi:hypothetical protein